MPPVVVNPNHFINVGPAGTFARSGDYYTAYSQVDELFEHLGSTKKKKLVVYFHGGLIGEVKGVAAAEKMQKLFAPTASYPLSFVWETSFIDAVKERLQEVEHTSLFKKLLEKVIKVAGSRLGIDNGAKGIGSISYEEIEEELQKDEPFEKVISGAKGIGDVQQLDDEFLYDELLANVEAEIADDPELKDFVKDDVADSKLLDRDKITELPEKGAKGIISTVKLAKALASIAFRVVKRHVKRVDHGFYPTVIEEIFRELYLADFGAWVWGGMKQKAEDMWKPNEGRSGDSLHAGSYFLLRLSDYLTRYPEVQVDLVGHSAGSIAIAYLLKVSAARHPELRFRKIVFLAPACTVDLFCSEIIDRASRYEDFRMYTMLDEYERKDKLVPILYPRSLLYFISGVLEGTSDMPLAGLHRHISAEGPYAKGNTVKAFRFLNADNSNRLVLSKTKPEVEEGLHCGSDSHGNFDDDPITHKSLLYYLS
jgi:pimeloyl-ACP methyl ester carboxylesterase